MEESSCNLISDFTQEATMFAPPHCITKSYKAFHAVWSQRPEYVKGTVGSKFCCLAAESD
jgi:hypothetical protein